MTERHPEKPNRLNSEPKGDDAGFAADPTRSLLGSHLAGGDFNPDLHKEADELGSLMGKHLAGGDFNPDLEPPEDFGSSIGRHLAGDDL
jgi:hypothetical protein